MTKPNFPSSSNVFDDHLKQTWLSSKHAVRNMWWLWEKVLVTSSEITDDPWIIMFFLDLPKSWLSSQKLVVKTFRWSSNIPARNIWYDHYRKMLVASSGFSDDYQTLKSLQKYPKIVKKCADILASHIYRIFWWSSEKKHNILVWCDWKLLRLRTCYWHILAQM